MMKFRWTAHNNNRMTWFDQVLLDGCGILFEINLIQECFNPGVHDIFNWRSWKTVQNMPYAEMNNMRKTSELLIVCIEVDVSLMQQHACIIAGCIVHWKVPNLVMPFQLIYNYKTGCKQTFDVAPTQSRSASIIQANRGPSWLSLIYDVTYAHLFALCFSVTVRCVLASSAVFKLGSPPTMFKFRSPHCVQVRQLHHICSTISLSTCIILSCFTPQLHTIAIENQFNDSWIQRKEYTKIQVDSDETQAK